MKPELQNRLEQELGLKEEDFAYHATDLYVRDVDGLRDWLKKNYEFYTNVKPFYANPETTNGKAEIWLDIPFAGKWRENEHIN